jgi:hypothetical protein
MNFWNALAHALGEVVGFLFVIAGLLFFIMVPISIVVLVMGEDRVPRKWYRIVTVIMVCFAAFFSTGFICMALYTFGKQEEVVFTSIVALGVLGGSGGGTYCIVKSLFTD